MGGAILVINAGPSSIKFGAYSDAASEHLAVLFKGEIEGLGTVPSPPAARGCARRLTRRGRPSGQ